MKTRVKSILAAGIFAAISGCAQQQYEPMSSNAVAPAQQWSFRPTEAQYIDTKSPAWNFQYVLDHNARKCSQEAAMGRILYQQLRDMGSSKRPDDRAQALADCQQYANQRGNEAISRLQQAMPYPKTLELSKDLYAKWSAYVGGMSIYSVKDTLASTQYETSRQSLLAEDKFAK